MTCGPDEFLESSSMAPSDNQSKPEGSARRRSAWRAVAVAVVALLALAFVALHILLRLGWAERQVRRELSRAVAAASAGEYDIDFRDLRFSLSLQNAYITDLAVLPATRADTGIVVRRASLDELQIRGIHWWRTLLGDPRVDEVVIRAPDLELSLDLIRRGADSAAVVSATTSDSGSGVSLELGTVRLIGGAMTLRAQTENGLVATVLREVDLEVEGPGRNWVAPPGYILATTDVSLEIGSAHVSVDDSLYALEFGAITASSADSTVTIGSLRAEPFLDDSGFAARLTYRQDRIILAMSDVALRSVDFGAALRDGAIRASRVVVDSFGIDVFSDHRIAPRPASGPKLFLTEQLRDLTNPIAIDTIVVMHGSIMYAERAADAERPGVILFEDATGVITNFSNDLEHTTLLTPMVARMDATLFGETSVHAELEIPLMSPTTDMRYEASAGMVSAKAVNQMTVPLEGLEFTSGELDTLYLEGAVTNGAVTGALRMEYRDLALQTVDKNTGQQNLGHVLATLLADALFVRRENVFRRGQAPVLGEISYVRRDGDTLWGFLWYGVRSGLLSVVIRGR